MLPEPPCIRLLVGCSDSDSGRANVTGDSGSAGSNRSLRSSTTGIGDSLGGATSSVRSTLGDLSARLPSFASGTLIGRSAKLYTAHYIITARNVGRSALQGVKITHGPMPFGAEFSALESDKSCFLSSTAVECTIDLAQGAQKELSLVYKAGGSMSCTFARLLQKAKTTLNGVTGTANAGQVVTTVTCRMEAVDNGFSQGSSSSSLASVNTTVVAQGSGSIAGTSGTKDIGYKQGYKDFTTVIPRTGAMQDLFASVDRQSSMIIQRHVTESSFFALPIFMISLVSIFIVCLILQRSFSGSASVRSRK